MGQLGSQYRYILDKSSKKFVCPRCGKRSAVATIDIETGNYLDIRYSRCDREQKCGYHGKPEQEVPSKEFVPPPPKPITYLSLDLVSQSGKNYKQNDFVQYLKTQFSVDQVKQIINDYLIGSSMYLTNGCIFWQIDEKNRLRSGKVMKYNPRTGKRVKEGQSFAWIMNIMQKRNLLKEYNRKQCLFGLHLINEYPDSVIAICESEKTACIMSVCFPKYVWMACGAASNLQHYKFEPLKDKKIILYPDLGQYDNWIEIADRENALGYDVSVSEILENAATEKEKNEGYDIADYFINQIVTPKSKQYARVHARERCKKPVIERLKQINPNINKLINVFGLEVA